DPTQAAAAADTLKAEGVVAIIGPSSGASMAAALPVLVQNELPTLLGPPLPYPNFNQEPYIFSPNLHQVSTQADDFIDFLDAMGLQNPIVITNDDASGTAIQALWDGKGYPVEVVPLDVTNYEPVLSELRDAG